MARSLSNAKLISTFVVDEISNAIFRRGYSATATTTRVSRGTSSVTVGVASMSKKTGEDVSKSGKEVPWIPDPVTGHYRPENLATEIDPAELRALLLKKH
ncbi:hypothetical protein ACFE04_020528 [Oxalis oulophora]